MQLQNVGPKTAMKLYDQFKIKNLNDLKKIIKEGKLKSVKGFGEKTEKELLEGIEKKTSPNQRHLLGEILPLAEELKALLERQKVVKKVFIAGSLARMRETIGDIDLLVVANDKNAVMDYFSRLSGVSKILSKGWSKNSVVLDNGVQVDLRIIDEDSFGSAVQYFVGSQQHNIHIRQFAIKKGLKLSEYGLFRGKKQVAGRNEAEIYKKLGMNWIPYELREDNGEIESAQKHNLPNLIELKDINGDLHSHTTLSDGSNPLEEMSESAKRLGYEYLAITDHSQGLKIAGGASDKDRKRQFAEIAAMNKKNPQFRILKGIEVDIKKDGSLDASQEILRQCDIVVASIHSSFKQDEQAMTKRVLKAMDNDQVSILGHPTGRLLLKRNPIQIDIENIIEKAKERSIILEINAQPDRLDLNDIHARLAGERGAKLCISTDAHSADSLKLMRYGIGVARRAWLQKKDVVNTKSLKEFEKVIHK